MKPIASADEKLSEPIKVRLSVIQRFRYEQAGAHEGLTLSAYIRKQLLVADNLSEELKALRALFVDLNGKEERDNAFACSLESLLILRAISEPNIIRSVHAAMQNMGVQPISAI